MTTAIASPGPARRGRLPDPNDWLAAQNASSIYGASMGRRNMIDNERDWSQPVQLVRMVMVDGDYDRGGAYWGCGSPSSGRMYVAKGDGFVAFVRAKSREEAKAELLADHEELTFYR